MKKNFLTITTIVASFLPLLGNGQTVIDTSYLMQVYNSTEYIFEGEVVEQCTFRDPSNGVIYTDSKVEISRFCKGSLQCGTVSVITLGGQLDEDYLRVPHSTQFSLGFHGIFLCNESPYYTASGSCIAAVDNPILAPTYLENTYIQYHTRYDGKTASGLNCSFEDLQVVYNYIQLFTGQPVVECNTSLAKVKIDVKYPQAAKRIATNNLEDNKLVGKKVRSSVQCKFGLTDSIITYDGLNKYIEFDYYIKTDDTIFVDTLSFNLCTYGPAMFGNDLDASTTLSLITASLPTPKYVLNPTLALGTDSLMFVIERTDTLLGTQFLPNIKYPIVHAKVLISDCYQYPYLSGGIPNVGTAVTNFKLSSTDTITNTFGSFFREKSIFLMNCEAKITSLICSRTGNNVSAGGIGDTITLVGKHFGNNLGNVFVQNANLGYGDWVALEDYEQISSARTDTTIKFVVNNFTSGIQLSNSASVVGIIGSGLVLVKNQWQTGAEWENAKMLKVDYSLIQYFETSPYYKNNSFLLPYKDSSYTFYRNTNVPDSMRWTIKKAIKDWSCLTGVNWQLSESTNNSWNSTDSLCNIKVEPFVLADSNKTIGLMLLNYRRCLDNTSNTEPIFILHSMDFQINPKFANRLVCDTTKTKPVPVGKVDFYRLCLHEIGHGHMQDHVVDSNDVMFTANTTDSAISTSATNRVINLNIHNQSGGDKIMIASTNILQHDLGNGCNYQSMVALPTSCRLTLAINEQPIPKSNFIIFPNPTNGLVNIKFKETITKGKIEIFDISGRLITSKLVENQKEISINFNCTKHANYLLRVTESNGQVQTIKMQCE